MSGDAKTLFSGAIALVTGASRGLGKATALALAAEGAQIIAVARTVGALEELDDEIQKTGAPPAVLVPLDITDGDGLDRMGAALHERFGRLDLLVHAAAQGARLTPVAHLDPDEMEKLAAVNATATHRLIRSLDPLLRAAERPVFAYIHDDRAGGKYWSGYGATKAAGAALAASYAAETPAVRVLIHEPPKMPTHLRARTHPGEDRDALTPTAEAAARLLVLLTD